MEREANKFKEMALKYQQVAKSIGLNGILLPSEVLKMKMLKHATKKSTTKKRLRKSKLKVGRQVNPGGIAI